MCGESSLSKLARLHAGFIPSACACVYICMYTCVCALAMCTPCLASSRDRWPLTAEMMLSHNLLRYLHDTSEAILYRTWTFCTVLGRSALYFEVLYRDSTFCTVLRRPAACLDVLYRTSTFCTVLRRSLPYLDVPYRILTFCAVLLARPIAHVFSRKTSTTRHTEYCGSTRGG